MKKLLFLLILFLISCSFDNKSGIWENQKIKNQEKIATNKKYLPVFEKEKYLNTEIKLKNKNEIQLSKLTNTSKWTVENYDSNYQLHNLNYINNLKIDLKSNKLSRRKLSDKIFYLNQKIIFNNFNGEIFVYSIEQNKIIFKYNFYKKFSYKRKKILNILVDNNIIYAADNFGYLYALNYSTNKILWAKNYGVPFNTNILKKDDSIYLANSNSTFFSINKKNGEVLWSYKTENKVVRSSFNSIILIQNENIYYLNNFLNVYNFKHNLSSPVWVSSLITNRFEENTSNTINNFVVNKDKLIVSQTNKILIVDNKNALIERSLPIKSDINIISSGNLLCSISNTNFLICFNSQTGKILWSKNIDKALQKKEFVKLKKKIGKVSIMKFINDNIFLFTKRGYLIKISPLNQKIISIDKTPVKLKKNFIIIEGKILNIINGNKLVIIS